MIASQSGAPVFPGSTALHALMQTHDWSTSPLGPPQTWPPGLRSIFRMMLDSMLPMSVVWGPERVLLYNDSYIQFLGGKHPSQALGLPIRGVWPEVWSDIGPLIDRASAGEAFYIENLPLTIHRNGQDEAAWFTFSYSPVRDDSGALNGMCSQVLETTSRVLAEQKLRQLALTLEERVALRTAELERALAERAAAQEEINKQRYAEYRRLYNIFKHAPGWVNLLRGPDHVFEQFNEAYRELVGDRELLGKPVRAAFPDVKEQSFFDLLDRVYATGNRETLYGQKIQFHVDGRVEPDTRYINVIYEPVRELDGSISGIFVQGTDVTEQKRTENVLRELNDTLEHRVEERTSQLRQAEAGIRSLIDSVSRYLGTLDLDGRLSFCNQASLTGIHANLQDVVGTPFWETPWFTGTEGVPAEIHAGFHAVRDGASIRRELTLDLPIGKRTFDFGMWPIRGTAGDIYMVAAEGVDITEQRVAEAALRQAQKMEAVGQLTGGLAHDFNNLLASLVGNLEMMRIRLTQGRSDELERHIDGSMSAVKRASALTHRLLAFSRRQTLDAKVTDVSKLTASMVELIARTVGPGINITAIPCTSDCYTLCDRNQLENALLNLAINARDAMPDGGSLTLETQNAVLDATSSAVSEGAAPGEYVVVSVTDTGTGMTPEVLSRAFDPFFTTKPIGQGTGLGLSMTFGFVSQSNGHLQIDTAVGTGTTVRIYLPACGPESETTSTTEEGRPHLASQVRRRTVLIVDDEASVRELMTTILNEFGYNVLEAPDGAAGLRILQSAVEVDLLVSDVGLPGNLNGRQLADAARTLRPDLAVLFVTGYAENVLSEKSLAAEGMQILTKPFSLSTFAAKVDGIINEIK